MFSLFWEVAALVSAPPGSLVYLLVVLFALEMATTIAVYQWRKWRTTALARVAFAAGGVFALRLALLGLTLLASLALLDSLAILPPMDRALSFLTLLIIVWSLLFPAPQRAADFSLIGLFVTGLLVAGLSLGLWIPAVNAGAPFYNGTTQDAAWAIAHSLLLLVGLVALIWRRPADWGLGLALLAVLLAGQVVHYLQPLAEFNVSGVVRLSELVGLPLFTALLYSRAHAQLAPVDDEPTMEEAVEEMVEPPASTVPRPRRRKASPLDAQAAVALASLNITANSEELGQVISLAISRTFRADICLFITPPDGSGSCAIAAGYDLIREQFLPGVTLPFSEMPHASWAVQRGEIIRLNREDDPDDLNVLAHVLEIDQSGTGPVMIAPILNSEVALMGGLILLSPYVQHHWSPDDQKLLAALIEPIAATLSAADTITELKRSLANQQNQVAELEQVKRTTHDESAQLTTELEARRAEAETLIADLQQARVEVERQRQEADKLARQLQLQHEQAEQQATQANEMNDLRAKLFTAQHETEALELAEAQLRAAEERVELLAQFEEKYQAAQTELEQQRDRFAQLTLELSEAQARLKQLQVVRAASQDLTLEETQAAFATAKAELLEHAKVISLISSDLAEKDILYAEAKARLQRQEAQLVELQAVERERATLPPPRALPAPEVIASLTQDLRQPLSSIFGYAELLLGESVGILGTLQRKFLERIKVSSERMVALLDDLIRITAIDSGPLKLITQEVDVVQLIEDAVMGCGTLFREKGINLRLEVADDLPKANVDADALRQILAHLLNNAAEASTIEGEVTLTVKRETERANGNNSSGTYLCLAVRDSGGGISLEDQPRVFSRLYHAEAPLIAGLGEKGVGLSIAKALVEAHGGRIWVTSDLGSGSTFNVLLPMQKKGGAIEAH